MAHPHAQMKNNVEFFFIFSDSPELLRTPAQVSLTPGDVYRPLGTQISKMQRNLEISMCGLNAKLLGLMAEMADYSILVYRMTPKVF